MNQELKQLVLRLAQRQADCGGVGPDKYSAAPCYHPMADAKYLSSLGTLRDAGLISESRYKQFLAPAIERLRRSNLSGDNDKACWGLGFAYKQTSATEPFLITTSLVVRGLLDNNCELTRDLCGEGLNWLNTYPQRGLPGESPDFPAPADNLRLPTFSPNTAIVVNNVVAYWAAVLSDANREGWDIDESQIGAATDYILSQYRCPVGWTYRITSPRIDLLHTGYILNALGSLQPLRTVEDIAMKALAFFRCGTRMIDKLDLMSKTEALEICQRSSQATALPVGDSWLVRYDASARLWSYGETLTLLCRLAKDGLHQGYWAKWARRLGNDLISQCDCANPQVFEEIDYPRDAMHLLDGMGSLWALLREENTDHSGRPAR